MRRRTADAASLTAHRSRAVLCPRAPASVVRRARSIAEVCQRDGSSLPEAALAFPIAHPAVVSVCIGARSSDQIARNLHLASNPVPPGLWAELKDRRLLHPDAPVPS